MTIRTLHPDWPPFDTAASAYSAVEAPVIVAELLKTHQFCTGSAGNGQTEPYETWVECSCGVLLHAWQQHYDEHDDRQPHVEYAAHIAWLAVEATISEVHQ